MIKFNYSDLYYDNKIFKKAGIYVNIKIDNVLHYLQIDLGSFTSILYEEKLIANNIYQKEIKLADFERVNSMTINDDLKTISPNVFSIKMKFIE